MTVADLIIELGKYHEELPVYFDDVERDGCIITSVKQQDVFDGDLGCYVMGLLLCSND